MHYDCRERDVDACTGLRNSLAQRWGRRNQKEDIWVPLQALGVRTACTGCNAEEGPAAEESICTDTLGRGRSEVEVEDWFVAGHASVDPQTPAGKKSLVH